MRLIDADELEEMFLRNAQIIDEYEQEDEFAARGMNCYGFKKLLDEQPTAYNVDKVVKQIENNMESLVGKYNSQTPLSDRPSYKIERNDVRKECIDIIRKGGVGSDMRGEQSET